MDLFFFVICVCLCHIVMSVSCNLVVTVRKGYPGSSVVLDCIDS